jgi:hypothetical protein
MSPVITFFPKTLWKKRKQLYMLKNDIMLVSKTATQPLMPGIIMHHQALSKKPCVIQVLCVIATPAATALIAAGH